MVSDWRDQLPRDQTAGAILDMTKKLRTSEKNLMRRSYGLVGRSGKGERELAVRSDGIHFKSREPNPTRMGQLQFRLTKQSGLVNHENRIAQEASHIQCCRLRARVPARRPGRRSATPWRWCPQPPPAAQSP